MWFDSIGVDPERDVTIMPMGGDQLVAAIAAGQVDAVVYGEPQIVLIQRADPKFKVLLYGKDLVPGLPGGVVMVQQWSVRGSPIRIWTHHSAKPSKSISCRARNPCCGRGAHQ